MMAPAKSDPAVLGGGPQKPAFGPEIWAWGPACGLALWALGFLILPWWAAIFLWWWPSILFGAALGLATIGLAKRLARITGAAGDRGAGMEPVATASPATGSLPVPANDHPTG